MKKLRISCELFETDKKSQQNTREKMALELSIFFERGGSTPVKSIVNELLVKRCRMYLGVVNRLPGSVANF